MAALAGARRRVAVVLFNLGGPDTPEAVRPFLFNLFSDPDIIEAPAFIRRPLATFISRTRTKSATANYAIMGGGSPLMPETTAQAEALQTALAEAMPDAEVRIVIAMRYWRPFTAEAAAAVAAFAPDEIVLAPLYPQFAMSTTGSSLKAWNAAYRGPGRTSALCCYPTLAGLVEAHATRIEDAWAQAGAPANVRLLFSAHGLPERMVQRGDPYESQIEATAAAVAKRLGPKWADWRVCYQSRVGPMKWLGPSTLDAIETATGEGLGVVIAPIAFVSEHVETLVELDHEYAEKAAALGCPIYVRAPALGVQSAFIVGLAGAISRAAKGPAGVHPASGFACAAAWSRCPSRQDRLGAAA
jgi:ferrochelatase